MAKSYNQKLKLLYLMQLLYQQTDEQHPISMDQIIKSLKRSGIAAERKSIYDDIETLRQFGMDILMTRGKQGGYYLLGRDFEIAELKLLVDSVQSSQFITEKKTMALIKKLEGLCSAHEAKTMRRQVYVANRIKHMNESIYYNVDELHTAIAQDRKITFRYFEYLPDKKKRFRRDGARYQVSPFALTWDSENYYLIAFDDAHGMIRHYRVDRMQDISIENAHRDGVEQFKKLDMAVYTRRAFSMFGGENIRVDMEFTDEYAGVVMDRFGKDTIFVKSSPHHFSISAQVIVSPQFFAWVFGLGEGARITGPNEVIEQMKKQLHSVQSLYVDN